MHLNKTTRYGLFAALEMARRPAPRTVTAATVADSHGVPAAVMAKVFQELVRSGIAVGTRGTRGGYRLSRGASQISVLDVIEVFEPPRQGGAGGGSADDPVERLLAEVDLQVRATFASVTLAALANPHHPGRAPR